MLGGAAGPESSLVGTFGSDPGLNIGYVRGRIIELLDCLPNELLGNGWEPFIRPDDFAVTRRMSLDLQAGNTGVYDIRAQSRAGDPILHLRIRTLVLMSGLTTRISGVLDLLHAESRRAFSR